MAAELKAEQELEAEGARVVPELKAKREAARVRAISRAKDIAEQKAAAERYEAARWAAVVKKGEEQWKRQPGMWRNAELDGDYRDWPRKRP